MIYVAIVLLVLMGLFFATLSGAVWEEHGEYLPVGFGWIVASICIITAICIRP